MLPPADARLAINPLLGDMFVPANDDEVRIVGALRAGVGSWRDLVDLLQTDELIVLDALVALYERGVVVEASPEALPDVQSTAIEEKDQPRLLVVEAVAS
jgi:hypothetical protein